MTWIIDQLIAFLAELRAMSLLSQVLALAGLAGVVSALCGVPIWIMTRKVRASVIRYEDLEQTLSTTRREAAKLEGEVSRLKAATPEAFLRAHAREAADGNDEPAMSLAEGFIDRQRDALLLAFRTRMDEAIRQSVEDGAPAFEAADGWARAALALAPRDRLLRMLVSDLGAAAAVAAESGLPVRLKDEADREERLAGYDRLPDDLDVLEAALFRARDHGHYALMLFLAGHGLMLTRREPFGEGSEAHLMFRRHRAEASMAAGDAPKALPEMLSLLRDFPARLGERAEETLYTRHLAASCRLRTDDAAGALAEAEDLLPLRTEVRGPRHPSVLTTRHLVATCRQGTGDAAGALAEAEDLLPLEIEVLGPRHPDVLATRYLVASCRQGTGDAAGALAEAEDLLPLRIEVQGPRHPDVLATRYLVASCRQDTGDAAGALAEAEDLLPLEIEVLGPRHPDVLATKLLAGWCRLALDDVEEAVAMVQGVRAALEAAQLRPEHILFASLNALESDLEQRRRD